MKVSLLNKTNLQLHGAIMRFAFTGLMVMLLSGSKLNLLLAEGSKNFVNYPGYRMFLDTRDNQQLKVFANAGEYINVGSSHRKIQGAFIRVYRPNGTLAVEYNPTTSGDIAFIKNWEQERNGPIGGATGYTPGVIQVQPGEEGVWTVIFDYDAYINSGFTNILNNYQWGPTDQPQSKRAVLAWDITVSSNAAGNMGGMLHEGRVFSNEHISLINGNGVTTSPTFYVLTRDGFLYEVNVKEADPFRFPISSNSLGLVTGDQNPTYKSKIDHDSVYMRSNDPNSWLPDKLYLYEPQAEDFGPLVNNKIFFTLPDTTMPDSALVTDIFRNNTYNTWLYKPVEILELTNFSFVGANPGGPPCGPGSISFGKGGWFIFETNLGGTATLQLDLNGNGIFNDPEDVVLMGPLSGGVDSLYWNGANGLGVQIPLQDSFAVNYQGNIRFGELHIALTDVENNYGGVTFKWLNDPNPPIDSTFYYDHTDVGGPISVDPMLPPTPGEPQPTTIPYIYSGNAGNDKYLDQWFFIEYNIDSNTIFANIVIDCVCENATPVLSAVSDPGEVCEGDDIVLSATNSTANIGDLTYNWTGPNSFIFSETIPSTATSVATINNAVEANEGTYLVIASTATNCRDTLSYSVVVNPVPVSSAITGGGSYCDGDDVTLTAMNMVPGISTINYEWSGPNFSETGTVTGTNIITATIPSVTSANAGTYTLVLTSENSCTSVPVSANITVSATPVVTAVSGSGNYCEDGNISLTASNSNAGVSTMICVWTGPNNLNVTQNVNGSAPIVLNLTNVNNSFEGTYSVVCSSNTCSSAPATFNVIIDNVPEINGISPNGSFCAGTAITLTGMNVVAGTGPITYTWTGPNPTNPLFPFTSTTANELGPFPVTIPNLVSGDAGTYCLVLETAGGCQSTQQCVDIAISAAPNIVNLIGAGDACIGQDVVLSAMNSTPGVAPVIFTWSGPNGIVAAGVGNNTGPYTATITNIDANDAGQYTLSLVSDLTNCVTDTTFTINVFPGLNIENVSPDSTYCEGEDVVLTASNTVAAGDLTYQWTGPNGEIYGPFTVGSLDPLTANIPGITLGQAGTYTLTVTSSSGCVADPITVEIGVNPSVDIVSVTGGGQYCVGADVILSATGQGSATDVIYTWTDPNGAVVGTGMTTAAGPFPATIIIPVEGAYNLVVSTSTGCGDSVSVDVEFIAQPVSFIINNDTTLCDLDTLSLCGQNLTTGIGVFDYIWTTPNGDIITGTGNGNDVFCDEITPLVTFGAGLYTLLINANGCVSEPDSFFLDLNPNPVISQITGGGTYCEGETVELCFWNTNPAVDSFFYTCVLPGGIQTTGVAASSDTICLTLTEPGFVCCSLESFDGCVSSLVCAEIIYEPAPDIEATAQPAVLCEDETLALNGSNNAPGSGDVTYTWIDPSGGVLFTGIAPWDGPFPASDPNPQSGDYCLIVSNGLNCVDTACVTVTVNPVPVVNNSTINGGGEFCEGEDAELTATVSISDGSDITYTWTLNGNVLETGTVASGTTITLDLSSLELIDDGEYCLELVSNEGCEADPVCTTVTVNPTPTIVSVTGGGTYCEGVDVMLNGTGEPGLGMVTYTWFEPNGGVVFTGTAPSEGPFPATIPNIAVDQAGVYSLVLTIGDCDSEPQSVVVEVNPKPEITNVSGGGTFCENEMTTISFTIDPNGATSVDWSIDGPGLNESGTVTEVTTLTFDVTVSSSTAGTYTITASSDAGCEAEPQSVEISIQIIPPPVLTASPGILCPGDELQLSTEVQQGTTVSYEWFKDGVSLGTTTSPVFDITNPMAGNYTVTVNVDGCSGTSAAVSVTVLGPPDAVDDAFTSNTLTPISGNVLTNDSAPGEVTITIVSGPSSGTVQLTGNGGFTYTPGASGAANDEFVYEICLVECPEQCDQASVTITYDVECVVPNIITPNGVNDDLKLTCVPPPTSRMRIFNRWGDEINVFEPYDNAEAWDGTMGSDKKPVPAGTYFFLFEPDKNSKDGVQSGYVKVVR
jgi:hypothetical protein